jgi:hypothetical protein
MTTQAAVLPSGAELYSGAMEQLRGWGNAQQEELKQSYRNAMGLGMQSLASAGLSGTTVAPSMRMGYMRQYQMALNNLSQQVSQARLGAMQTFGLGGQQLAQGEKQLGLQQQQITNQMQLGQGQLALGERQANISEDASLRNWMSQQQSYQLAQKQFYAAQKQQQWNNRAYEQSRADAQAYLNLV